MQLPCEVPITSPCHEANIVRLATLVRICGPVCPYMFIRLFAGLARIPSQCGVRCRGGAFAPQEAGHEVLQGVGLAQRGPGSAPSGQPQAPQLPGPPPITAEALKTLKKAQKKQAKHAKREAKKDRKVEAHTSQREGTFSCYLMPSCMCHCSFGS